MSNVCPCPNPPGGSITCDDDQIAICRVSDGRVESYCLSLPGPPAAFAAQIRSAGGQGALKLLRWVAAKVRVEVDAVQDPASGLAFGRVGGQDVPAPLLASKVLGQITNEKTNGRLIFEGFEINDWDVELEPVGGVEVWEPQAIRKRVAVAVTPPRELLELLRDDRERRTIS